MRYALIFLLATLWSPVASAQLPPGIVWSNPVPDPTRPLVVVERGSFPWLAPGNYDFECRPVSDNWALAGKGAYTSAKVDKPSTVSLLPRFPVDEPSCGFVMLSRGPYAYGTAVADRGDWVLGGLPSGQSFPRMSMPIYTHSGARTDRYGMNGYRFVKESGYPAPSSPYWNAGTKPLGPLSHDLVNRQPITPAVLAPHVTRLSCLPNQSIYVAYSFVSFLGEETVRSPVVEVAGHPEWDANSGCYAVVSRSSYTKPDGTPVDGIPLPPSVAGVYLYVGLSPEALIRTPVLSHEGSEPEYLWPRWLTQYPLHQVFNTGPAYTPIASPRSPFNAIQKQVEAGEKYIAWAQADYDCYGPLVLPYDSSNFGRYLGDGIRKANFHFKTDLNGTATLRNVSLIHIESQYDTVDGAVFPLDGGQCPVAAGLTSSDYSGAQAMSVTLKRCTFLVTGQESYGLLVDERSRSQNSHTCSELTLENCIFAGGASPVKLEWGQTAKILFKNCEFGPVGHTDYLADTCKVGQISDAQVVFEGIKGANGIGRSFITLAGKQGDTTVRITNPFCDAGTYSIVTFSGIFGGSCYIGQGGTLNAQGTWHRQVEAPAAIGASVVIDGTTVDSRSSSISYQLNQLRILSTNRTAQVVAPNLTYWLAKGLPAVTDQGFNFKAKQRSTFSFGYSNVTDTISPSLAK